MKKIITILTILLLVLCPLVLANGNGNGNGNSGATQTGQPDEAGSDNSDETGSEDNEAKDKPTVQERNRFREELGEHQSEVKGLENAMLRVRNEEVKQHLESVMNKIQTRTQERLNQKDGLEIGETIDGNFECKFKDNARFLGLLKMERTFTYNLGEDGELQRQKGPWDFLWKQEDLAPLEE